MGALYSELPKSVKRAFFLLLQTGAALRGIGLDLRDDAIDRQVGTHQPFDASSEQEKD